MRFLHTSDWHLGRSLHRADLRAAQAAFLDHLVETARAERVDAVLVSGDVYDRAIPPLDAVAACEDALVRLRATGARVILISGNHDSQRRLGFSSALIDAAGVHLRTRPHELATPVLLDDNHGPVAVYGLPYLEPAVGLPPPPEGTTSDPWGLPPTGPGPVTPRSHQAVLGEGLARIRADASSRGLSRVVVLAHAWVTGTERSTLSDSERDIRVGGVGDVPASLFDGLSYVALGHLHGPQLVTDRVRYSGSPLPYSFSEAAHVKGSWLVELAGDGQLAAEHVPAPVYRRLTALRGDLKDLLTSPAHERHEADFVAVTLTDPVRPQAAMDRLRARFPHVLTLEFKPEGVTASGQSYGERIRGKDDLGVAAEFISHVRNAGPTDGERELLRAAFAAATGSEE
ncbi:MAG TPA: exonuclease SbcCD subunit D [Trebonia sp.]|nr:exonuclease SbcCD subunit D [Trebonia sp.]